MSFARFFVVSIPSAGEKEYCGLMRIVFGRERRAQSTKRSMLGNGGLIIRQGTMPIF